MAGYPGAKYQYQFRMYYQEYALPGKDREGHLFLFHVEKL